MFEFDIEEFINNLPDDITIIDVSNRGITYIPDLSRFTNLKILICCNNKLTSLPELNDNLEILNCCDNLLTSLPKFNKKLKEFYGYRNKLTCLPEFNENLELFNCHHNELTFLPKLNDKLQRLSCRNNQLTYLPKLNKNLQMLDCDDNKIKYLPTLNDNLKELYFNGTLNYLIELDERLNERSLIFLCYENDELNIIKNIVEILNNFRHLYYSLKFKKPLRKLLWEKIREPKIRIKYHPTYLNESLDENADLDEFLEKWI